MIMMNPCKEKPFLEALSCKLNKPELIRTYIQINALNTLNYSVEGNLPTTCYGVRNPSDFEIKNNFEIRRLQMLSFAKITHLTMTSQDYLKNIILNKHSRCQQKKMTSKTKKIN